jgi:cysteine sulfinate desulfinase/cysteine desulfurase-like protein
MLEKAGGRRRRPSRCGHFAVVMARKPKIVSVMLANNETGVLQDLESLADCARMAGAWFHTDAVQAVGKLASIFVVSMPPECMR